MRASTAKTPSKLILIVLAAASLGGTRVGAGPSLPIPCAPGACGATGASQFISGGSASAVASNSALTINQTTASAILNWASFNIGAGGSVAFKQPTASSIALNRIFQGSPSQIFGRLTANGQVYLINLNGFLFGPASSINVGGLLVSSLPLNLTDATFSNGILSPLQGSQNRAAFDVNLDPLAPGGRTSVLDINGNPVLDASGNPIPVQVVVQPGAQITAADQGRLLLAGQTVTNSGSLVAPDGQIVLAAGSQVFLQASTDPNLRGLVVEVDANNHNTAWNQLSGTLSAPRGNVTLVGLAVNQDGRISATTSVAANGSIRLEAAAGAVPSGVGGTSTVTSTQGGPLTIGPQSQLQILPELATGATANSAQDQPVSSVTLLGEQVIVQGGSIVAPAGNLTAIAAFNPAGAIPPPGSSAAVAVQSGGDINARLRIDAGTSIDLSGSTATLPVTANLVAVQLRSSELADDPTQRDGALHGQTVYIDSRHPPPASFANVSGEIASVPEQVAQRTEQGGHAILQSSGDLVFANGASLNVSGGSTTYTGATFQTSYLIGANGRLYPIGSANPMLDYVGVLNPTFTQTYNSWGVQIVVPTSLSSYQPGYVQGAAAGSVQFAAPSMVLQGSLSGSAVNGLYQRTPSTAVPGGQLIIGVPGGVAGSAATGVIDYLSPSVRLSATPTPIAVADDAVLPGPMTLELPAAYLTSSGFTSAQIYSNYGFSIPTNLPLTLPAGSTLSVDAARLDLLSSITDAAGTLSFQNVVNVGSFYPSVLRPGVYVGDEVTFDVRGRWTNDALSSFPALAQTWQNGGSISLGIASIGALLSVGDNVTLQASGGAWNSTSGALTLGQGGKITLADAAIGGGLDVGANLAIDAFGVNGAAGGTFSLTAPRLEISAGNGNWTKSQSADESVAPGGVFQVYSSLFSDFGFANFQLTATALVAPAALTTNVITVDPATPQNSNTIAAIVPTLSLEASAPLRPSAPSLDGLATIATLAPYLRQPAHVSLTALPVGTSQGAPLGSTEVGDVLIGAGAAITTDPGGSIAITGLDSIVVDGTLRAPGGIVSLHVLSPTVSINDSNPYQGFDAGFLPNQRIELGPSAVIDVAGTLVSQPSSAGFDLGTVYAGGTVNLLADRGAIDTYAGSLISLYGVSAALDVLQPSGGYAHSIAATAGGAITAESGQSISLLGNIEAAAGSGGTSGPAAAGSLTVQLTRPNGAFPGNSFNQAPLIVEIEPNAPANGIPEPANSNHALLGSQQLAAWGIDALTVQADGVLQFSGSFALNLGRQFIVDAPVISADHASVSITAPYLELGYEPLASTAIAAPLLGAGSLSFTGSQIDLVGNTVFQGTNTVSFSSSGDLLLRGPPLGSGAGALTGSVAVAGNLALDAERIYPITETSFSITAATDPSTGTPGRITIGQTGSDPGTPLSAGGTLVVSAYSVTSTGSLYAPFGMITLNATSGLTLGDGSLTSVSGGGLTIPFGQTQFGGQNWFYGSDASNVVAGVPQSNIRLSAPAVTITQHATLDLRGGGDLSAFEWVPGPGGSIDALAPPASPGVAASTSNGLSGLYAIIPSTRGLASPQDPENINSAILPGESIYLSGGGGVSAGYYPLLPARYALTPGAFLIQIEPQYQSVGPGALGNLADGTPVVAGFLGYGTTGLHQTPGFTGFAIYPGSYGSDLAQYTVNLASTYFADAASAAGLPRPTLPADAGSLSISVSTALDALGTVRSAAASGGIAATIGISAQDLFVGTGPVSNGTVEISPQVLAGWQPGALLLGGVIAPGNSSASSSASTPAAANSTTIDVQADRVTIGSGSQLQADQITLVANQSIEVQSGASLQSMSANGAAPATPPAMQSVTLLSANGNAALLAVSDLNWLIPLRAPGTSLIGAGVVTIDGGASVASRGSLSIDALGGIAVADGTLSGPRAEWSLGSASIAFVPAGVAADTLSIDPSLVAQLNAAGAVRLASAGPIDVMVPGLVLTGASGAPLQSLTLQASSLNNVSGSSGSAGASSAEFGANTLVLEGSGGVAPPPSGGPAGSALSLIAGELDIGPGAFAVNGFAEMQTTLSGGLIGHGAGSLSIDGALTIAGAGVTAATAADLSITATDQLVVSAAGGAAALPQLFGGAVSLTGSSLDVAGNISAPSGLIALTSTSGDLTIEAGANISTAGAIVSIGNQVAGTAGGNITVAAAGNLLLGAGATFNVAGAQLAPAAAPGTGTTFNFGGTGLAPAGVLSLTAGQSAQIGNTLNLIAGGTSGGSFTLDAGALASSPGASADPLGVLAAALSAGHFTNAINLRARTGSLNLLQGSSLTANSVTLTADSGQLTIAGDISAPSGALRGTLTLFGGAGVEIAGGQLHADGGAGYGGTIEIGAGNLVADSQGTPDAAFNNASISFDANSVISAQGAAGMGTLLLRAPALVNGAPADAGMLFSAAPAAGSASVGIQGIANLASAAIGQIVVEPVMVFNTANNVVFSNSALVSDADFANVHTAVGNYMGAVSSNFAALVGPVPLVVEPGVDLVAPGALTLQSLDGKSPVLDLAAADATGTNWRFNGQPVDLTIRAAGDLNVNNTIQDGFAVLNPSGPRGVVQPVLLGGLSSSIHLVAGADLASADPLAAISPALSAAGAGGDLTIGRAAGINGPAQVALVRTGTGSVDLIAADDIIVAGAGSGAYTAGDPVPATVDNRLFGTVNQYGVLVPASSLLISFPGAGGSLNVSAGEDIVGAALQNPGVPVWQLREGGNAITTAAHPKNPLIVPPEWGVNLNAYNWNFATLGGGDLTITAGRDALNLTAAAADSLVPQAGSTALLVPSGGLSVTTGRDLGRAEVFLADGTGSVVAGGALSTIEGFGSAFYLESSSINVTARLGIATAGVFNPTSIGQNYTLPTLAKSFFSYGENSALTLQTVAGDILLDGSEAATVAALGPVVQAANNSVGIDVLPPTLAAATLGGNIVYRGSGNTLYPSSSGQLDLLAAQDITSAVLALSDAVSGTYSTIATPTAATPVESALFVGAIHASDQVPALVTAGGSITESSLSIPKPAEIVAGKDIGDLQYSGQNLGSTEQTVLMAGRDITYGGSLSNVVGTGISVGGPGELEVLAGRNVTLGFSPGIVTTGNLDNPNLPTSQGAGLTIVTGLGTAPNVAGFMSEIVAPSGAHQAQLVSYVESVQGSSSPSFTAAEAQFNELSPSLQLPFIDAVFFQELSASGIAANTIPGAGFTQGYAAIDALFPGSRAGVPGAIPGAYAGDLTLDFSRIYTLSGGDINLVVPGGFINVGLAIPPVQLQSRPASTLGIVAQGAGNVDIYSQGDVDVNASRIFTLGGGNILIWSNQGSIDAGRGAKSALSAPPPTVLINANGTVSLNFSGAAAGSGIRTIQTEPTTPAGNVDLIAPVGTVNAGDAGIGAAGNINIAAQSVIGVANINFGGTASGVPALVSNVSASLAGASSAGSGASNAATGAVESSAGAQESATPLAQAQLSWLDVFVTGLGEENCKPDDIECLKRQKTPTR